MVFVTLVKAVAGKGKAAMEALKAMSAASGPKVLSCYVTFGRYDAVCVWEAPDLATASRWIRTVMEQGVATTETMLAQSPDDFLK